MSATTNGTGERVLLFTPLGRDAALACKILADEGITAAACRDMDELCREVLAGAGAVLLTEEALSASDLTCLLRTLERQELWSDLPLVLFTGSKESARFFMK